MSRPKLREPNYKLRRRGRYWTLSWTDSESGRTRAVSTGQADEARAKIWKDQFVAGLQQPDPPAQPLVSEILDGYLANRKPIVQSYARLEFAAAALKRHVGNLQPHMLSRGMYRERRQKEGVGDGTMRREVGVLRAALAWAVRERWIDRAPYIDSPPSPPPRERWLTREEVETLINACASSHVRRFAILAYHTAARAGAILDLTWDRVDLERRRIDYRRPSRRATNKRRATVPMNAVVLAELRAARQVEVQEAEGGEGASAIHVINQHGRALRSIKRGFAAACRRAGIHDCSPHVLRHTAATHMVMARVPLAEIARMLGDTEAMVERVYGKHSPDYLRRAADALAGDLKPRLVSATVSENGDPS